MTNLYLGNYLKLDKLKTALHSARVKGKLVGVNDSEIDVFIKGFLRVIEERHMRYGDQISYSEVEEILKIMERDHTDIVDNKELDTIKGVVLDKSFTF